MTKVSDKTNALIMETVTFDSARHFPQFSRFFIAFLFASAIKGRSLIRLMPPPFGELRTSYCVLSRCDSSAFSVRSVLINMLNYFGVYDGAFSPNPIKLLLLSVFYSHGISILGTLYCDFTDKYVFL